MRERVFDHLGPLRLCYSLLRLAKNRQKRLFSHGQGPGVLSPVPLSTNPQVFAVPPLKMPTKTRGLETEASLFCSPLAVLLRC